MRKNIPFQMVSSRKTLTPTLNCSQCPESQNPSGTVSELSRTSCPLNESYLDIYLSGNNSLNVARAMVASHSTYVFNVLLWASGSPSLQILWTLLVHRIAGLCNGVLQLPVRLCNSVYSPSHSGLYYMGHNSIIYNSSSKSDWFSP